MTKEEDKKEILAEIHDSKLSAHPVRYCTLKRAHGNYYWKGMNKDVDDYVASCHTCQKEKGDKKTRLCEVRSPVVPKYPFEVLHMDWITDLAVTTQGHDIILVFVCVLSGMVHVQVAKRTDTAKDTAGHMLNNIIWLYGLPRTVVSDRDVRLTGNFWKIFHEILGTTQVVHTSSYTPNANDKVERANQVLGNTLWSLCNTVGTDLDVAEFAMNTSKHTSIDMSPFNLIHLRESLWPDTLEKAVLDVPTAKEMADHCFAVFSRPSDCLEVCKLRTEKMLTVKRRRADPLTEGDMVLLPTKNLRLKFTHVKLLPKFVGHFEIVKPPPNNNRNPNSVWLKTPKELKIQMPINIKDVRRYTVRPQHFGGVPSFDVSLPLVEDGYSKWEVEVVLVTRVVKKTIVRKF